MNGTTLTFLVGRRSGLCMRSFQPGGFASVKISVLSSTFLYKRKTETETVVTDVPGRSFAIYPTVNKQKVVVP